MKRCAVARQRAGQQDAEQGRQGAIGGQAVEAAKHDQQQAGYLQADPRPPDGGEASAQQQVGQRLADGIHQRDVRGSRGLRHGGEERPKDQQAAAGQHDQPGAAVYRCAHVGMAANQDAAEDQLPRRQHPAEQARRQVEPPAAEGGFRGVDGARA